MHFYELDEILGSGKAAYSCPTCAEKVLVLWYKGYPRKEVIQRGDSAAIHCFKITEAEDLKIRAGGSAFTDFLDNLTIL